MRRAQMPPELLGGPFTLRQAKEAGLTSDALQSAPWRRIFREVWVHVDVLDTLDMRFEAVRLILPESAVVCGLTAAWLHGVDVRRAGNVDIHVSFPKGKRTRHRDGVVVSQETLDPSDIVEKRAVCVTSPVRTAFDCLRLLRGWDRLVVADALARRHLVTVPELRDYFASKRRLRNLRVGEALIDGIEPKSDSPMETRMRLVIVDGGVPRPQAQVQVCDDMGGFIGWADLGYPELKVAIEYDGALHWRQRRDDDRRRDLMRGAGWVVLVFSADDIYKTPHRTVRSVREARARAAAA